MFITEFPWNCHKRIDEKIKTTTIPNAGKEWTVTRVAAPLVLDVSEAATALVLGFGAVLEVEEEV